MQNVHYPFVKRIIDSWIVERSLFRDKVDGLWVICTVTVLRGPAEP